MSDIREIFKTFEPDIQKYKSEKHIEIEFRIGKVNMGKFDTDVGEESFDRLMKGLRKYEKWEKVTSSEKTVYFYDNNVRLSIDEDDDTEECIKKNKLIKNDIIIKDTPFDVRMCVSKELPHPSLNEDEISSYVRHKKRTSFVRKNLSIDMTIVSGDPEDLDDELLESYEVELEICHPEKIMNENELFNIIHKIQDVMNVLKK